MILDFCASSFFRYAGTGGFLTSAFFRFQQLDMGVFHRPSVLFPVGNRVFVGTVLSFQLRPLFFAADWLPSCIHKRRARVRFEKKKERVIKFFLMPWYGLMVPFVVYTIRSPWRAAADFFKKSPQECPFGGKKITFSDSDSMSFTVC